MNEEKNCPYGWKRLDSQEDLLAHMSLVDQAMSQNIADNNKDWEFPCLAKHNFEPTTNTYVGTEFLYETDAMHLYPKHPRVGVCVAVMKNGEVLVGKRKGSHGAGSWGFPGGHLEHGESPEACAVREVAEETGLVIRALMAAGFTNDFYPDYDDKHYVTLFYFAEIESGTLEIKEPNKCEEWKWVPWNKLAEQQPLFVCVKNFIERKNSIA